MARRDGAWARARVGPCGSEESAALVGCQRSVQAVLRPRWDERTVVASIVGCLGAEALLVLETARKDRGPVLRQDAHRAETAHKSVSGGICFERLKELNQAGVTVGEILDFGGHMVPLVPLLPLVPSGPTLAATTTTLATITTHCAFHCLSVLFVVCPCVCRVPG